MTLGTPVLASNASSIPEVVGNAALLFDPMDANAMMLHMTDIFCNADLRNDLAARGYERAKMFSWDASAQEIIDIYKSVLASAEES